MSDALLVDKVFVAKEWDAVKAHINPDGTVSIEGWISTPHQDMEKDIAEPESFLGSTFENYFARGAPLSSEHNTSAYPIGHLQKSVLVRDGTILQECRHPVSPADEFLSFDGTGSGWYGLGIIDDPVAATAVAKGKMRSFSWIGSLKEFTAIPGGGRRFVKVEPLIEATVTAYPMNPNAVMRIAKAYMGVPETPRKSLFVLTPESVRRTLEKQNA